MPDFVAPQLERSFYDELPILDHVRRGAEARRCAPDAVLLAVLCRIAALVTPAHRLTTERPLSLNLCGGLVAPPGYGKSTAWQAARGLVPDLGPRVLDGRGLGTGEGLIDAYLGAARQVSKDESHENYERPRIYDGAAYYVDEGDTMLRHGLRQGSTLLQHIRTAWSGYALSTTNANGDTRRHLPDYSYAFALCAAFQANVGGALLADSEGGTPQRFLLASAQDRLMPDVRPTWPGPFAFRSEDVLGVAHEIGVNREIEREVDARTVSKNHGTRKVEALDTHEDAIRLKVAGLLAVLSALVGGTGHAYVGLREWTLASQVARNSVGLRRALEHYGEVSKAEKRDERVRERNAENEATDEITFQRLRTRIVERLEDLVLSGKFGDKAPTESALWDRVAHRDRSRIGRDEVLPEIYKRGRVSLVGGRVVPVARSRAGAA